MGLAIAYQIIEKHQGKIEVSSEPGKGASFAIVIPIHPQDPGAIARQVGSSSKDMEKNCHGNVI